MPPFCQCTLSELHRHFSSLESENAVQELTEFFALYLQDYCDVRVVYQAVTLDPQSVIATKKSCPLPDLHAEGKSYPARLEIIEWKIATKRVLYLCNDHGFPLSHVTTRSHGAQFQFSAYLKSPFVTQLHDDNQLELAGMNPLLMPTIEEAQKAIQDYFRERAAEDVRTVVEEWKAGQSALRADS